MACCGGGHHEDRFQTSVDKNFFCPICQDVLKDPVQCHNEHYFCKACITRHLKNSKTCPVCMERVTEETLTEPPRIVSNYLDGLIINCDNSERGCTELIELGRLEAHIRVCKYKPVMCPNEKCATIMNLADLEQHTSEVCEYRQVYCEECDENMSVKKYCKHGCVISKDFQAMKASLIQMQNQIKEMAKAQKGILEVIRNLPGTGRKTSTAKGSIVVIGGKKDGAFLNSVEMYSLTNRRWRKLAPMQEPRASATAHFYHHQVMVTGGYCARKTKTDSIEFVQIDEETTEDVSSLVSEMPFKCAGHKTAILNDHLWIVGGSKPDHVCSDAITTLSINLPFLITFMCEMPKPISYHGLEIVNGNELLIIGGSTSGFICDAVDTVLLYNTVTNKLTELYPLPLQMCDMATVKHGEDVIIIGGTNKDGDYLNTVFKYNYKKNEYKQLPGMKHKRSECAAVISGNKVFVMGGHNDEQRYLCSVECFDLDDQVWYELPSMSEAKYKIVAVFVP